MSGTRIFAIQKNLKWQKIKNFTKPANSKLIATQGTTMLIQQTTVLSASIHSIFDIMQKPRLLMAPKAPLDVAAIAHKAQENSEHDPRSTVIYKIDDSMKNTVIPSNGFLTKSMVCINEVVKKDAATGHYSIKVGSEIDLHKVDQVGSSGWWGLHLENHKQGRLIPMILTDFNKYNQALQIADHAEFGARKVIAVFNLNKLDKTLADSTVAIGKAEQNSLIKLKTPKTHLHAPFITGASAPCTEIFVRTGNGGSTQMFAADSESDLQFITSKEHKQNRKDLHTGLMNTAVLLFVPSLDLMIQLKPINNEAGKYQITALKHYGEQYNQAGQTIVFSKAQVEENASKKPVHADPFLLPPKPSTLR